MNSEQLLIECNLLDLCLNAMMETRTGTVKVWLQNQKVPVSTVSTVSTLGDLHLQTVVVDGL